MTDSEGSYVLIRLIDSKRCTDSLTFDATGDCSPQMALRERPPQVLLRVDSVATQLVFSDVWLPAVAVHSGSHTAVFRCSRARHITSIVSRLLDMSTGASVDGTVIRTNIVRP